MSRGASRIPPSENSVARQGLLPKVWKSLSRPVRWAIVITPGIALVVGLVGDAVDLWGKVTADEPAVRIENVALTQEGRVKLRYSSMEGGAGSVASVPATAATITLNNPTDTAVAFFRLRASVLHAATLRDCGVAGGDIAVSGDYQLPLPDAKRGEDSYADIAWQVKGHTNDAFRITIGDADATTLTTLPMYHLALSMKSGDGEWLDAGTMVVANELPHYAAFLDPDSDEVYPNCAKKNRESVQAIASRTGRRSPELKVFTQVLDTVIKSGSFDEFGDLCPWPGAIPTVKDFEPADLMGDQTPLVAFVAECKSGAVDHGTTVTLWSPDLGHVVAQYRPRAHMFQQGLTGFGRMLRFEFRELLTKYSTRYVREDLGFKGGRLVVLRRTSTD